MGRTTRFETLKALDEAGFDVRLWCFICGRGTVIAGTLWHKFEARGWPQGLEEVTARCRCRLCGSKADVLLVPASRPKPSPAPSPERDMTVKDMVVAFFHASRAEAKRRRREERYRRR